MSKKPTPAPAPGIPESGQQGHGSDGMTTQQRKFAEEYISLLGESGGNGWGCKQQAALNAGYAPSNAPTAAWKNLRNPAVMAYIASQLTYAEVKVPVDASYVLLKALVAVEMAEQQRSPMAMMRAVETIAKHKDVAALARKVSGQYPPEGGTGGGISENELAKLSDDEIAFLINIRRKLSGVPVDGAELGDSATGASAAGK